MKTLILLFVFVYSNAVSQIVVNEVMYAPSDATNEWFEIYNASDAPVNLQNWKWKDATSTNRTISTLNISVPSKKYLIICQDSVKFKNQFQNVSGIVLQTAWSTLNNTGDNVILINSSNVRIDSLSFASSWGGNTGGYSLERINPEGETNNTLNWSTSVDNLKATPGSQNSVTPKPFDLFLKSFVIIPLFPSSGESLKLNFVIKNSGSNNVQNFSLNIYNDNNFDSIASQSELINTKEFASLNASDSDLYEYSIQNIDTGSIQFIAIVNYDQDDDTLNNKSVKRTYVSSQSGSGGIVINEIMYDPLSNNAEWIELYNASGQSVNIKGWKYKEVTSSVTLALVDLNFNPGDYIILAHDSSIYNNFEYLKSLGTNQIIKFASGISLNNSGENISITDSLNNLIDAVNYFPGWHNPEVTDAKGISLERINLSLPSNERSNWSSCTKFTGGTPGERNSILTNGVKTKSTLTIIPNPFSPDGDGKEDFALIQYQLNSNFSQMRIRVFDIKGRLVRTLANNQITGKEGTIIFNGLGDDNQKLRMGIYILLIEAIDDRGGTVDIIKEPIVVAGKL